MAVIKPFKGVRPPKNIVQEVVSRPYDVLSSLEARLEAEAMKNHFIVSLSQRSI